MKDIVDMQNIYHSVSVDFYAITYPLNYTRECKSNLNTDIEISSDCKLTASIVDHILSQSNANKKEIETEWITSYDMAKSGLYNKLFDKYDYTYTFMNCSKNEISNSIVVASMLIRLNNTPYNMHDYYMALNVRNYLMSLLNKTM
jgi:hypothetical protein